MTGWTTSQLVSWAAVDLVGILLMDVMIFLEVPDRYVHQVEGFWRPVLQEFSKEQLYLKVCVAFWNL